MLYRLCFFILLFSCNSCVSTDNNAFQPKKTQPHKTIYLVSHGWHAGIVIKRSDIPENIWPEQNDFPDAEYLEIGWGESNFYQKPKPHFWDFLKAGLWPTPSVLHIAGFLGSITEFFPQNQIIRINLSFQGFEQLCHFIQASYAKDDNGHSIPLSPGLYGNSRFYLAQGNYHALNTCNVWTAKALRTAGCPITPAFSILVDSLMTRAAVFGDVIQKRIDR